MADKKISELDAISGSATASDDLFLIVDASGSVTKKITRAELNNAIEQDVLSTVDINGGTIDSTVIGGATPAAGDFTTLVATALDLGTNNPRIRFDDSDTSNNGEVTLDNNSLRIEIDEDNVVASSAIHFRVDGDNKVTVNESGSVGIGTSSPATILHVQGADPNITIQDTNDTGDAYIRFKNNSGTQRSFIQTAMTGNVMLFGTGTTEHMRLDASGNFIVGKTAANATAAGAYIAPDGDAFLVRDGQRPLVLNRLTSDGMIAEFRKDGTTVGSIGTVSSNLVIGTDDTGFYFNAAAERILPMDTSTFALRDAAIDLGATNGRWKDLFLSGGVYLGGTGSANLLDDYEEGSWSPTITMSTTNPSVTYSRQNGSYVKVGTIVTCHFNIYATSLSGGSGNVQLSNLPFTSTNTAGNGSEARRPVVYLGFATGTGWSSATPRTALVQANSTNAVFYTAGSSDVRANFATVLTTLPSTMNIYGSVTYISA